MKCDIIISRMSIDGLYGVNTQIAHFAEETTGDGRPVIPPIFQNSLFVYEKMEDLIDNMVNNPIGPPHVYSRVSNPTLDLVEQKLANLEGGEMAKVFTSGITAISMAILSVVSQGAHVVCVDGCYGPVRTLLTDYLTRFGVTSTFVDGRDTDAIFDAVQPNTKLIYLESPTSLTFRLQDLPEVGRRARELGVLTMIDNTYNTALHLRPMDFGIDVVCHSCTKYYAGHSDLTAGVVIGSKEFITNLMKNEVMHMGALLGPFQAWLLTRGTRTVGVRLRQHQETANTVAAWLESQPEIKVVHHLGLDSYPQKDLFKKMMKGSGGLFSFEPVTQDRAKIMAFCNALKLFGRGISWGGFESLVVASHVCPLEQSEPTWLIRLYTGLEDAEDLQQDIENALSCLR